MALNGEQVCYKQWTEVESQQRLSAIEFALESFLPMLKHYVKWYSDSQAACTVARVGSMRKDLHEIALRVYQLCLEQKKIEFEIDWIPCTELQRADFLSRLIDIDDWQITRQCFNTLQDLWGCHTLDCFANYYNTKISRFISWHWNPGCTGVDFLYKIYPGKTV